jgi:cation diffusion facilitator CzcD-associated flavoprotein CzcO
MDLVGVFAAQPELLRYIDFVATRLDLRRHFRFNTRIRHAVWDEAALLWRLTTEAGEVFEAPVCIMSTGPLSIPKDPEIPGIARFKGELYRAAKWPHQEVSYAGKRVGIIGTGSTGIQIIQEIGPKCGELFVFQRTPSFTMPMRNETLSEDYVAEVKRNYAGIRDAAMNSAVGGTRPQSTRGFFTCTPKQRRALLEDAWKQGGWPCSAPSRTCW